VGAVGLKSETLVSALGQLEGVILGCPAVWGDSYRLNLREAVLESKLVRHPEKIFILEDAIAAILAGLQCYELKDSKTQNSKPLGARLLIRKRFQYRRTSYSKLFLRAVP
jgi:hypothetical protein